jgi:hypothetical protein
MRKPRNRVRQNGSASATAQQAPQKSIRAAAPTQQGQGSAVAVAAALDLSADHQMLLEQFAKWWGVSVTEYCVRLLEAGFNCDGDVLHDMLRSRSSYPKAKRLVNFLKPIFQRVYGARGKYMAPCFEPTPEPSTKGLRV